MPSDQNRNRGCRENYEMQNQPSKTIQENQRQSSNENNINAQPSSSNQSSNRNQNAYNNRPIFNLQNPDYGLHIRFDNSPIKRDSSQLDSANKNLRKTDAVGYGKIRSNYNHQSSESDPSKTDYVYGVERPDYNKENSDYSNPFDSLSSRQNQDVFDRWQISNESELVNRQHRTTSIHRNADLREVDETNSRTSPRSLESRRKWMSPPGYTMKRTSLEQRANNIADRMEQDGTLMEDTPESEVLRREALRDMPQCLTVKRIIKKKLNTSVSIHSKRKPLGIFTRMKYRLGIKMTKAKNSLKSLTYRFELWYNSLKTIEGHFGSGVATYFKFFRWLFIMNCFIAFFTFMFLVIPQLLSPYSRHYDAINGSPLVIYEMFAQNGNSTSVIMPEAWTALQQKRIPSQNNATFKFSDIFTGQGYFTNTTLYYGFYSKDTISLAYNYKYNMPYAYFFTMLCMYVVSFFILSTSMARSYRRSFIETQGGLKNVYAHKIFCGWDYSIATQEAADLKSSSIYHELKELLSDSVKDSEQVSCLQHFWTYVIQIICNLTILCQLVGTGYIMWTLLEKHNSDGSNNNKPSNLGVITAAIINVIMLLFPSIFSFIARYEDYKHPRAALYVTLIRTFLLKTVIIGVFLAFWLTHSDNETCWETSIGQHIYRLIMFDFLFSVVVAALVEAIRHIIYKKLWKRIGVPEFDIARNTLQLIYNQTLFWVGLYYSPLLPIVVVLKLWSTWYIRRTCLLRFCQPSSKSWRAAQTHTWFLILSFLSLLLVLITLGYIMVDVATSNCGPFRDYKYMYEMILKGVFQLEQNNVFWKILMYLTKPGTVALILIAMCVVVYYLRAKAIAQKGMVDILREMLVLEAKDKEFLLENISKVTEGQWQYNLQERTGEAWNSFENACDASGVSTKPKSKEDFYKGDEASSSSSNLQDYSRDDSSNTNPFLPGSPSQSRRNFLNKRKY